MLECLDLQWDYIFTQTVTDPNAQNSRMWNFDLILFWCFRDFRVLKGESGLKESLVHRFPFYILIPWLMPSACFPVGLESRGWEQGAAVWTEVLQGFKFKQFFNDILTLHDRMFNICNFCFLNHVLHRRLFRKNLPPSMLNCFGL